MPGMDLPPPEALVERAHAAYLASDGISAEQPSTAYSGVRCLNGLSYVVLATNRRSRRRRLSNSSIGSASAHAPAPDRPAGPRLSFVAPSGPPRFPRARLRIRKEQ